MAAKIPLRATPSLLPSMSRSARPYGVRCFSMTRLVAARSSPLFDLNGLASSRESQHLSKEQNIPRTEYMPTLQLIRSGEVDPFAPAPGSSIRDAGSSAGLATTAATTTPLHYNRLSNTWSNEDGSTATPSGSSPTGTAVRSESEPSADPEPLNAHHGYIERLGIALLFGSITIGGLMLWGPDLWIVQPEHFNRFIDERIKPHKLGAWMEHGYGGQWMQFWDNTARTVVEEGTERSQKLNLDQRAEKFDGMVRPKMEKLGSAIRGESK